MNDDLQALIERGRQLCEQIDALLADVRKANADVEQLREEVAELRRESA